MECEQTIGVKTPRTTDKTCLGCKYNKAVGEIARGESKGKHDTNHRGQYRYGYCSYLEDTDHKRPCPPGEGCTVRAEGPKKKNSFKATETAWRLESARRRRGW